MKPLILLPLLVIVATTFSLAGCNSPRVASPPIQAKATPKPTKLTRTKKVEVTIRALPKGYESKFTSTYPVDANSKSTVDVDWNGYGFIITGDGRDLGHHSDNGAFKNQTARFEIIKKITISEDFFSATDITGSDNAVVKRGVKARF